MSMIHEVRRRIADVATILRYFDVGWESAPPDKTKLSSLDPRAIRTILMALYNVRLAKHALGEFKTIAELIDTDAALAEAVGDREVILSHIDEEMRVTAGHLRDIIIINGLDAA